MRYYMTVLEILELVADDPQYTALHAPIINQTDKAILVEVLCAWIDNDHAVKIWLPKSQIAVAANVDLVCVPEWLMKKKIEELGCKSILSEVSGHEIQHLIEISEGNTFDAEVVN